MEHTLEQQVATLVEPVIIEHGLELVDVEYIKEGAHWYLRLYIDKEDGVDLDDCANISHAVSTILDQKSLISQAYMLEVSSPGLERPLKKDEDFVRFKGELVTAHTATVFQGFQEFTGYLVGLVDGALVLEYEDKQIIVPRELIEKTHLTFEF